MKKQAPLLALAAGVVLLLGIVIAVVITTIRTDESIARQTRLFRASAQLNLLVTALVNAETGQRGYLITRDDAYLGPYEAALAEIPQRETALAEVISDDPAQREDFERLKALIPEKLAELSGTLDLARAGDADGAVGIVRADRGRALMDDIRATAERMRARQIVWLGNANAEVQRSGEMLRIGVIMVALGVALLGIYTFAAKRRQRLALERHSGEVEAHSRALEEANAKLTAEMESRRAAEDQVRQLQKMEAVGQLTGGIAHDFNNVLAVILSAVGLIRRRLAAGDPDIGKYVDGAAEAAERAASLTSRLLAFSRQQALQPAVTDPNRLVSGMSELLRRTLGETIELETVLAGGLWKICADPRQLENSLINLAVNARDAMPDGGRITIETANAHLDDAYARANPGSVSGQYVMIAVSDTGTGMTPEVIARAFDPFFTTKEPGRGTGLGLSQVYGFIKQSNGHIKIYSEVGTGTTVKVYVPRYTGSEAEALPAAVPAATGPRRPGETILVAEDDPRVRAMVSEALTEIGYAVRAVPNGQAALDILDGPDPVSLLFTDVVMPGMGGRKLAEEAVRRRPDLKVLYTTGFTRNAVVHNGVLDAGVKFIQKPFTIEALAAKIREVIDG